MPILSGLIVSVDAFFIGLSLGLQERCRFLYLVAINAFLFGLCMVGYFVAGRVYELITFEVDYIVGFSFIGLGIWCILFYFVKRRSGQGGGRASRKTIVLVGLVMSLEAMMITLGIVFVFSPGATLAIPVTVAVAHFGYSALSFLLARTKYVRRVPDIVSHIVSGLALVVYGVMAIFVEFGV